MYGALFAARQTADQASRQETYQDSRFKIQELTADQASRQETSATRIASLQGCEAEAREGQAPGPSVPRDRPEVHGLVLLLC